MTEDLEKTENRERAYGLSQVVNGERQHRMLTLRDKRKTLRIFADRVCLFLCCLFVYSTYLCCRCLVCLSTDFQLEICGNGVCPLIIYVLGRIHYRTKATVQAIPLSTLPQQRNTAKLLRLSANI